MKKLFLIILFMLLTGVSNAQTNGQRAQAQVRYVTALPGTCKPNQAIIYAVIGAFPLHYWMCSDTNTFVDITDNGGTPALTSTRIAFGSATNLLSSSATFTYNDTTKTQTISNGAGGAFLNLTGTSDSSAIKFGGGAALGSSGGIICPFVGGAQDSACGMRWSDGTNMSAIYTSNGIVIQGHNSTHDPVYIRKGTGNNTNGAIIFEFRPSTAHFRINPFGTNAGDTTPIKFLELAANGTNNVALKAPDNIAADATIVLPSSAAPSNNDVLTVTGVSAGTITTAWQAGSSGTTINPTNNVIPVRSNATTFVDSPLSVTSSSVTMTRDAIGATSTDGINLVNNTAAAVGAQQYSPRLRLTGQGWKTNAVAASQTTDWIIQAVPVQGAAAPSVNLELRYQVNGGGYADAIATGQILAPGGASASQSVPQYSAVDKPTYGMRIGGGNAGNNVAMVLGGGAMFSCDGNANRCAISSTRAIVWGNADNHTASQVGLYSPANDVLQVRDRNLTTVGGNLILGGSGSSLPTSATATLVFQNGTVPGSSPADQSSLYTADSAAGDSNLFVRNEAGEINRLSGLASRNSASFAKTSDTVLANITGLTRNVEASRVYQFEARCRTTAAATGGVKFSISGTATATAIDYEGVLVSGATIVTQTGATALDTTVCASTTATAGTCTIKGVIQVNAAGTLTVQFAQNASDAGASTVLANQYFKLTPIN